MTDNDICELCDDAGQIDTREGKTVGCPVCIERELNRKIADLNEVLADKRRLTRELDVAMHGEEGAAKQASLCDLIEPARRLRAEVERLRKEINTPEIVDFVKAVQLEAAHQRERWGTEHDDGKTTADWYWLIGYLAGKALFHLLANNQEKGLHHIITTAAACANWHLHATGVNTLMRPGIAPPDAKEQTP